ncbi:MAG: ABC transporter ATP-binding protein/permease [Firmicutes bacterium]|nr:ABC transporter ATP-binding protein/permease [Bacillota bacterium]
MIASGISRVNLDLDLGEFVVITGESGSGKSTLLNVISGLDSYEEGEMYINGEETSHYVAADFEEYRKKYIGNIFQNFNLVNSYTVYQNIELILRINGYNKNEIRRRVDEIIDRVGLSAFRRTKVSKLSGGQRQRVSIARALAKDTDIIVADEPTGNLDSESAAGIVQLLSEISRDKLVIVVTHNYDQFEAYATRRIKMHDGKVIENVQVVAQEALPEGQHGIRAGKMTGGSMLRLGVRNTFNIFYKFLLLLIVFLFLVFAVSSQYTTFVNKQYESSILGYNSYFYNYSNDRVVLKKSDNGLFTEEDLTALSRLDNVRSIAPNDVLLDTSIYLEGDMISLEAFPHSISEFQGEPDLGRLPEAPGEMLVRGSADEYFMSEDTAESMLDQTFEVWLGESGEAKVTVVGISFKEEEDSESDYSYYGEAYLTDEQLQQLRTQLYGESSTTVTTINGKEMEAGMGDSYYRVMRSDIVASGKAVVSEDVSNFYLNEESQGMDLKAAIGHDIDVQVKNMFYEEKVKLNIADVYDEKSFRNKTGNDDYETNDGAIFISPEDYGKLFEKGNYQCSVYMSDLKQADETIRAIRDLGYVALPLKDATVEIDEDIISMIEVPIAILIVLAIFIISYIVAGLILRSRSTYFSILRMLGLAKKNIRWILEIEVLLVANIAFVIFLLVVACVSRGVIDIEYLKTLVQFMKPRDYVVLYLFICLMALLISDWFARRLFRKTAMGSFREEE